MLFPINFAISLCGPTLNVVKFVVASRQTVGFMMDISRYPHMCINIYMYNVYKHGIVGVKPGWSEYHTCYIFGKIHILVLSLHQSRDWSDWCNDRFGLVGHVLVYIVPLSIRIYSTYNLNRSFLRVQLGQQKVKHGQAN